ncbi:hypothetical protein F4777DRAFT_532123 [Nemania sp. FL0916]|nr:hypothetical protein F4777DRAFT_532123 [Nemania sp. FL0916]
MACSTASECYMDRLPDELLLMILTYAMQRESPFFPEPLGAARIGYVKKLHFTMVQRVHAQDWCRVTMTCQRIRRLGKEAFFSSKRFVLRASIPESLRDGIYSLFVNASDQQLAMRSICSVVIVDIAPSVASKVMRVPKLLGVLPKLKDVTLVFDWARWNAITTIENAIPFQAPAVLTQIFEYIAGANSDVKVHAAICSSSDPEYVQATLNTDLYPILRAKAQMMAKEKERMSKSTEQ